MSAEADRPSVYDYICELIARGELPPAPSAEELRELLAGSRNSDYELDEDLDERDDLDDDDLDQQVRP